MLIESMRDLGYSLETALADIIDNSIAADATSVRIISDPSLDRPSIAVIDDGRGMTETELMDAMRAGSRNPLSSRGGNDLGRFGLGLKTASFSQCRKLTVLSRHRGIATAAIWDLEHVADTDAWEVLIPDSIESIHCSEELGGDGTLVLWENLDRLHGGVARERMGDVLAQRLSEAAAHLDLVFHRFLASEPGRRKFSITLNGRALEGHDPFASRHPATQKLESEQLTIKGLPVSIEAFTLPHHSKMSVKDYERIGGAAGHLRNQGFYLYRERRLIIWGTWFGLARQRPMTNLSRVRIDMPRDLDPEWKVDVKKSSAQPPAMLRDRLRQLVERIGASSKRVYTHKGQRLNVDDRLDVWSRQQDKGEIRYRFNPEHPVYTTLLAELPTGQQQRLKALMQLMEASIPFDAIFADRAGDPKAIGANALSATDLALVAQDTYKQLNRGTTERSPQVLEMMSHCEPFASRWAETVAELKIAFHWE